MDGAHSTPPEMMGDRLDSAKIAKSLGMSKEEYEQNLKKLKASVSYKSRITPSKPLTVKSSTRGVRAFKEMAKNATQRFGSRERLQKKMADIRPFRFGATLIGLGFVYWTLTEMLWPMYEVNAMRNRTMQRRFLEAEKFRESLREDE